MHKSANGFKIIGVVYAIIGTLLLCGALASLAFRVWLPALVLGIIGVVFAAIGYSFLGVQAHKRRLREQLIAEGELIHAEVVRIEPVYSVQVNGCSPFRVICRYTEGGTDYICRSELYSEPPALEDNVVAVYRDPRNYKHYYVDVDAAARPTVVL